MKRPSGAIWWRLGLALFAFACIALAGAIWVRGGSETQEALDSGRRLLITLKDGSIEGKWLTAETPKSTAAPSIPPESKPEEVKPDAKPAELAPPAAQTSAAEPPEVEETVPQPAPAAVETVPQPAAEEIVAEAVSEPAPELPPLAPSANPPQEPSRALLEKSSQGMLPVIGSDGNKPWRHYAKPFERKDGQPIIAIVITGLGHHKAVTENVLRLPENITLSFSPYARDIESWATSSRVSGHEALIDLPMEPANYPAADPGPYGLLVAKGPAENTRRLEWLMTRFAGYAGFLTPQDEIYSGNDEAFRVLLQSLANRGLMLVVGREPYKNSIKTMIETSNTASVIADTLVDEDLSVVAIQARLSLLEQLAKKRGYAVGIAQPYPVTVEQLKAWSETLASKGIILAPVSAVVRLRFS